MARNTTNNKLPELAKQKSEKRLQEILKTIDKMIKKGEKVSFYSVQKETGASKSYLYNNEIIRNKIEGTRNDNIPTKTKESKDTLIKSLQLKIKKLEIENEKLKELNSDSYKDKYEKILEENKSLKEQLKNSYEY